MEYVQPIANFIIYIQIQNLIYQEESIRNNYNNKQSKKLQYIGKLNKKVIGKYGDKLTTYDVVLTDERKLHILNKHKNDYEIILNNINNTVLNPQEVLEDYKNVDTLFFLSNLENNNLNVVVKLNTLNDNKHPQNSVMTAWIIRNSNLIKLREKNKTIYKKE